MKPTVPLARRVPANWARNSWQAMAESGPAPEHSFNKQCRWYKTPRAAGSATLVPLDERRTLLACPELPLPPGLSCRRSFVRPRRDHPRWLGAGSGRRRARDDARRHPRPPGRGVEARLQPLPRRHRHAVAGHRGRLRAAPRLQPRHADLRALAGHGLPVGRRQPHRPVRDPPRGRLVRRPAVLGQGRGLHLRPDAALLRPRPRRGVGIPRRRQERRRVERRVHVQARLHAGAPRHRHAAHRRRAQVEGRGPARGLRRPEPGGHRSLHGGASLRAHRLRAGPESEVLAEGQARGLGPAGAALSQRTRRSCAPSRPESWTGRRSSWTTSRSAGWPRTPRATSTGTRTSGRPRSSSSTPARRPSTTRPCARP